MKKFLSIFVCAAAFAACPQAFAAASVNIGSDRTASVGESVSFVAEVAGCEGAMSPSISWHTLDASGSWILAKGPGPHTDLAYSLTASASTQVRASVSCTVGPFPNSASDIAVVTVSSSGSGPRSGPRSNAEIMAEEAKEAFMDDASFASIPPLVLAYRRIESSPLLVFEWGSVGGEGQVTYEFQYSTGAEFAAFLTQETTDRYLHQVETSFDASAWFHYFRVRACYAGRCTPFSSAVRHASFDPLGPVACVGCGAGLDFADAWSSPDFLADRFYSPACGAHSCSVCRWGR